MHLKRAGVVAGVGLLTTALAIPVSAQASAPSANRPSPAAELASVVQASDAAAANGYTLSVRTTSSTGQATPTTEDKSWSGPNSNITWVSPTKESGDYTTEITDPSTRTVYSRLGVEKPPGNGGAIRDAAYQTVLDVTGLTDDSWLAEPVPDWVVDPSLASDPFSNLLAGTEGLPGWKRTVKGSTVTYTLGGKRSDTQRTVVATDGLIVSYRIKMAGLTRAYTVVSLDGPAFEVPDISQVNPATPELSQTIEDYLKESTTLSTVLALVHIRAEGSLASAKRILANEIRSLGMKVTWVKNKATVTSPVSEQATAAGFPDACGTLTVLKNKKLIMGAC